MKSSIISKIDERIKSNKISLKDLRTQRRFWSKPKLNPKRYGDDGTPYYVDAHGDKIEKPTEAQKQEYVNYNYHNLKIFPRWYYWQPTYDFLPVPDRYEAILKNFNEKVWGGLEDEEYYILASGNNIMTIILQNRKQYDWIRPDCVFFFGRNTKSPEGRKWKEEKAAFEAEDYKRRYIKNYKALYDGKTPTSIPEKEKPPVGEDMPLLWWVRNWRYINIGNLYAEVILEKCYVWHYYGNWMNTYGSVLITESQINNNHIDTSGEILKPELPDAVKHGKAYLNSKAHDLHWPKDEDWRQARKWDEANDKSSPAEADEKTGKGWLPRTAADGKAIPKPKASSSGQQRTPEGDTVVSKKLKGNWVEVNRKACPLSKKYFPDLEEEFYHKKDFQLWNSSLFKDDEFIVCSVNFVSGEWAGTDDLWVHSDLWDKIISGKSTYKVLYDNSKGLFGTNKFYEGTHYTSLDFIWSYSEDTEANAFDRAISKRKL